MTPDLSPFRGPGVYAPAIQRRTHSTRSTSANQYETQNNMTPDFSPFRGPGGIRCQPFNAERIHRAAFNAKHLSHSIRNSKHHDPRFLPLQGAGGYTAPAIQRRRHSTGEAFNAEGIQQTLAFYFFSSCEISDTFIAPFKIFRIQRPGASRIF